MNYAAFPTKGERTRAHIVASAAELFWERSFNGVSVDEIASAAGVNKATVYRYFADKADLALASARYHGIRTLEEMFEENFRQNSEPEQRLAAIYSYAYCANVEMKQAKGDLLGCPVIGLVLELSFEMPQIRDEASQIFMQVEKYLEEIARDAIAAGRVTGSPKTLARSLMQLLHGAFSSSRIAAEPEQILDAGHTSLAIIGYPETRIPALSDA